MNHSNDSIPLHWANVSRSNGSFSNSSSALSSALVLLATTAREIQIGSVIFGCISYLGAVLNLIVLAAAWPNPTRKSGFAVLVCHFTVLNFLMCLVEEPSYLFLSRAVSDGRQTPTHICRYVRLFYSTIEFTINWADVGMAFNRFVALFFPLSYRKLTSKYAILMTIIFAWVISVFGTLIPHVHGGIDRIIHLNPLGMCTWSSSAAGNLGVFAFFLLIVGPYSISALSAVLIFCKSSMLTYRRQQVTPGPALQLGPVASSRALRHRLKMSRMLLLTYVWTGICIAPGNFLVYVFPGYSSRIPSLGWWLRALHVLQYSFTPCVMIFYNDEYRKRLRNMLAGKWQNGVSTKGFSDTANRSD